MAVEIRDRQVDDLAEKLRPQPVNDPLAETGGEKALQERRRPVENVDPQHHAEKPRNPVKAPGHEIVDGAALQTRGNDARRHGQDDAESQQNHIFELRAEITH